MRMDNSEDDSVLREFQLLISLSMVLRRRESQRCMSTRERENGKTWWPMPLTCMSKVKKKEILLKSMNWTNNPSGTENALITCTVLSSLYPTLVNHLPSKEKLSWALSEKSLHRTNKTSKSTFGSGSKLVIKWSLWPTSMKSNTQLWSTVNLINKWHSWKTCTTKRTFRISLTLFSLMVNHNLFRLSTKSISKLLTDGTEKISGSLFKRKRRKTIKRKQIKKRKRRRKNLKLLRKKLQRKRRRLREKKKEDWEESKLNKQWQSQMSQRSKMLMTRSRRRLKMIKRKQKLRQRNKRKRF